MFFVPFALAAAQTAITNLIVTLPDGVTMVEIQKALDSLPAGGQVILPAGKIEVTQPIVLQHNGETLRGAGETTILFLAENANCPVIIMGQPVNHPKLVRNLRVEDLFIDGNRAQQSRELWHTSGEGSEIRNNGITVQHLDDAVVENVTCARCRSGGLVTTRGVERLAVGHFESFGNQFDGLACYETTDSKFTHLYLHDNPGAGISLDQNFYHNVIDDAVLAGNDLGIFMRWSHDNDFENISIRSSHNYGVFMAQNIEETVAQTECTNNSFTNLIASQCARAIFRVNDVTCTNNFVYGAQSVGGAHDGFSLVQPDLVTFK